MLEQKMSISRYMLDIECSMRMETKLTWKITDFSAGHRNMMNGSQLQILEFNRNTLSFVYKVIFNYYHILLGATAWRRNFIWPEALKAMIHRSKIRMIIFTQLTKTIRG